MLKDAHCELKFSYSVSGINWQTSEMEASEAQAIATVSREVAGFLAKVCERRSYVSRYEPKAQSAMATFNSRWKTKGLEYG